MQGCHQAGDFLPAVIVPQFGLLGKYNITAGGPGPAFVQLAGIEIVASAEDTDPLLIIAIVEVEVTAVIQVQPVYIIIQD